MMSGDPVPVGKEIARFKCCVSPKNAYLITILTYLNDSSLEETPAVCDFAFVTTNKPKPKAREQNL